MKTTGFFFCCCFYKCNLIFSCYSLKIQYVLWMLWVFVGFRRKFLIASFSQQRWNKITEICGNLEENIVLCLLVCARTSAGTVIPFLSSISKGLTILITWEGERPNAFAVGSFSHVLDLQLPRCMQYHFVTKYVRPICNQDINCQQRFIFNMVRHLYLYETGPWKLLTHI